MFCIVFFKIINDDMMIIIMITVKYCYCLESKVCVFCYCRSYSINHVPRTNLMLLVVDSLCVCDTRARFNTEPVEIKYILCCFLIMHLQQSSLAKEYSWEYIDSVFKV